MPRPLETHDRKKHSISGSTIIEDWGSSGVRTKRRKREFGAEECTGKSSELFSRVEPNLEPFRLKRKTMDARIYKSRFKRKQSKDKTPGTNGVSNGSGSRSTDNMSERRKNSHNLEKSLQGHLKPDIIKLCEVLQLPENVRDMVEKFLKYVNDKHRIITEPQTKLQAFRISLCWNSASLLKYKIDKKESLILAKQHLHFGCSVEEVNDMDSMLQRIRKTFVIDLFNVKELDSSKKSVPLVKEIKKVQEQPSKVLIDDRESQRCREKAKQKLEVPIKRLDKEQKSEIDGLKKKCEKRKVKLLEHHKQRAPIVRSGNSDKKAKLNKLKRFKDEFKKTLEHNGQVARSLKDLTAHYLAKKSKRINASENNIFAKLPSSEEVKEGARMKIVGDLYISGNGSQIVAKSPSCEKQLPNEQQSILEEAKNISSQNYNAAKSISGNNVAANSPSPEVHLPLGATTSVKEATKSATNKLSLQQEGCQSSKCTQTANIEAPTQKDDERSPTQAGILDKIVNQIVLTNPSEQHRPLSANISVGKNQPTSPSALPSSSPGSGHRLVSTAHINQIVLTNPSEQRQPSTANISVGKNQPTSPSALPSSSPGSGHGLVSADHINCASKNISENNIGAQPTSPSALPSSSPGSRHGLVSAAQINCASKNISESNIGAESPSSEEQLPLGASPAVKEATKSASCDLSPQQKSYQLSASAQTANLEAQAEDDDDQISIEAGTCDSNIINELVSTTFSEKQPQKPSADISVDTNQPIPPSANIGRTQSQPPSSNINTPIPPSDNIDTNLPPPVGTNRCHPVPASVVELAPPRESPIITTSSLTHIRDESFLLSRPHSPRVANIDNNHLGTAASVNSYIGHLRSNPVFCNTRQTAPPMTAQGSTTNSLSVDTNQCHPVPAFAVERVPQRESHIVTTSSLTDLRDESPLSNQPQPPRVANDDNSRRFVDTPVFLDQGTSRVNLGATPVINSSMGDLRSYSVLQGARQPAPQMIAQRLTSNPLYNEYERLCRETARVVEVHENTKLQLKSDCEKEVAEIRKKYEFKLNEAEAEFSMKKKELDMNSSKVFMNGLYAQSFQNMVEYKPALKLPQEVPSNLMQQVHLPHSQAQPVQPSNFGSLAPLSSLCNRPNNPNVIISPSNFTSSARVLTPCNRLNSPFFFNSVTPRSNFQDNLGRPLLQHFRSDHPFSATSFSSVPQRGPPQQPTLQSVQFGMGPRAAVGGNPYVVPELSNFHNQMTIRQPSILQSVSGCGSNLNLLSQVLGNNGGGGGTNTSNSRGLTDCICLSDDE